MTTEITRMTDETLLAETRRVAELERRTTAGLLALLIELENRSLHLTLGYSSMFVYCTRALLLSEQAAFKRITAARVARRYPIILQGLAEGELTLSSIKILAPHLTDENVDALVEAARRKSTREVEQLIAAAQAQPDVPASVRALPAPKTSVVDAVTLQNVRALLRHVIPGGDLAAILDRALTLLLQETERTKWASARRRRSSHEPSAHGRHCHGA